MQVLVPSTPARLRITPTMVDDFLIDPVMGMQVLLNIHLDAFQAAAARLEWWVPNVIDESGLGTGKSLRLWGLTQLRALLIEDQACCAYYQTFQAGKDIFWPYYNSRFGANPFFRAQLGQVDVLGEEKGKDNTRGAACYIQHFKNGSKVLLPAPNWLQQATGQAGKTLNWVVIDEWTKVEVMSKKPNARGGATEGYLAGGINQQILGRLRGASWNQHHMLWGNHCIFSATAETTNHPSQVRVNQFLAEIRKGNPNYAIVRFNFKDASNRKSATGRPFREEIINWNMIRNLKAQYTRSHFLREGLGIRVRETRGFYSEESLHRCVLAGVRNQLEPEIGRSAVVGQASSLSLADEERQAGSLSHYFLGIDPAPAQRKTADEGALAVLRVRPKPGVAEPSSNLSDWQPEFVWAYRVTPRNPFTVRQWSGFIHEKHRHFKFSGICMDPMGGGQWILTELNKTRQLIAGIETEATPIASLEDITVGHAHFILNLFRGSDASIGSLWPAVQGVDGLYDAAHTALQQAVEHTEVFWPQAFNARLRETTETWPEQKQWALKALDAARSQLQDIQVATQDDGTFVITRHGARQFSALGKKDLAYACLYAYVRFLVWLKMGELEFNMSDDGESGFYVV